MKIWLKSPDPSKQCCDCSVLIDPCAMCASLCPPITGNIANNLYNNTGSEFYNSVEKNICFSNGGAATLTQSGSLLTFSSVTADNCQTAPNPNLYAGISNSPGIFSTEIILYSGDTFSISLVVQPPNQSYIDAEYQNTAFRQFFSGAIGTPLNPSNQSVILGGLPAGILTYERVIMSQNTTYIFSDLNLANSYYQPIYVTNFQPVSSGNLFDEVYLSEGRGVNQQTCQFDPEGFITYDFKSISTFASNSYSSYLYIEDSSHNTVTNGTFLTEVCPGFPLTDFDYTLYPHNIGMICFVKTKITGIALNLFDKFNNITGTMASDHGCYTFLGQNQSTLQIWDSGNNPVSILSRLRKYVYPSPP